MVRITLVLDNNREAVDVDQTQTVRQLKVTVSTRAWLNKPDLEFVFWLKKPSRQLDDKKTLIDYNIYDGAELDIIIVKKLGERELC